MIEILASLEWESIVIDAVNALFRRDQPSVQRLVTNVVTQIMARIVVTSEIAAIIEGGYETEEELDFEFIRKLKDSTSIESGKIRFTSEGGFVIE